MFRVRTLQIVLCLAVILQTVPPAQAVGDPNATSFWDSIGNPDDPNGLAFWGGGGDDVNFGRVGVVKWPFEIGVQYSHYIGDDRVDGVGLYAFWRQADQLLSRLKVYGELKSEIPEGAQPEPYVGPFGEIDTQLDGARYGGEVGIKAGSMFVGYRYQLSEGDIRDQLREGGVFVLGAVYKW